MLSLKAINYKIKRIRESPLSFLFRKLQLVMFSRLAAPYFYMRLYKFRRAIKKRIIRSLEINSRKLSFSSNNILDDDVHAYLSSRVGEVLDGRYECLGYGRARIGGEDWLRDCIHDASWPSAYFTKLDIIDSTRTSDIKIVWEKSRLQFLPEIAILAVSNGECNKGLVDKYFNILTDWDRYNPLCFGPNWVVSMEVAIRSANILFSAYILFPNLSHDRKDLLARMLFEHYLFLRWFPEISDVEGNHSLVTQMGLCLFRSLLSESSSVSSDNFLHYAKKQFTEDGFHIEYSPTYHRLCVEVVLVAYANELLIKGMVSPQFDLFVKKILECCNRISIQDATLPVFGDNDSGHVFNFGQSERDFSYLWNVVMGVGSLPCNVDSRTTQSKVAFRFWSRILERNTRLISSISKLSSDYVYPFKVVSVKSARLIMRVGSFGLKGRAPHDHDDNLSFVLQAFGKEIITDKGCPPYTLDRSLRNEAISSLSHNVVQIKNKPRSRLSDGSIFKTVQGAAVAKSINISNNGEISAALSLKTGVDAKSDRLIEHFRELKLSQDGSNVDLRILDKVVYQGVVSSQHRIHFAQGVCLILREGKVYGEIDGVSFIITFEIDGYIPKMELKNFDLYDCYGHSVNATVLLVEVDGASSYTMVQNICISGGAI